MELFVSKLTSKYQATIPKKIRDELSLGAKDRVVFEVKGNHTVVIRKLKPLDLDYLKSISSTLSEWDSQEDDEAFRGL